MRYLGSKTDLLSDIKSLLTKHLYGSEETFLDLFAGTNSVGKFFKSDFSIYSNDMLYFSYVDAKAHIENNNALTFSGLKAHGIHDPLNFLQDHAEKYISSSKIGYYEGNYTPIGGAMYFTKENGKRIDYIRDKIDEWNSQGLLTKNEYYYLIAVLIDSIPYVSNITGTYGAFLKHWDKRALKPLELRPLVISDNTRKNKAFNKDANQLIRTISTDIAYIDTPYTNRQYASNYHVLENIARNEKPELSGKTRIFDWHKLRSDYAMQNNAFNAMRDLLAHISASHILVSYNSDGIIPEDDLTNLLRGQAYDGKVEMKKIPYRRFKSHAATKQGKLYELLFYIQKNEIHKTTAAMSMPHIEKKWGLGKRYIKSPLNYVGGKYRLLKQIIPLFPTDIDTFVDLFSGGANVGINATAKSYIFNDMNSKINEMFRFFAKQNPDVLIANIKQRIQSCHLSKTNEEAYLKFRDQYNKNPNPLDLYVLVSYSYNYQFRFNNSMEFNNPFGRNRSKFSTNMENNLRLFINRLQTIDATFIDGLFTDFDFSDLSNRDFVYLDPPYLITTGSYNDGNRGFRDWNKDEELSMYKILDNLTSRNIRYALSNVLTHKGKSNKLLQQFIDAYALNVYDLSYKYNNASYNSAGLGGREVLITNYDPNSFEVLPQYKVASAK